MTSFQQRINGAIDIVNSTDFTQQLQKGGIEATSDTSDISSAGVTARSATARFEL